MPPLNAPQPPEQLSLNKEFPPYDVFAEENNFPTPPFDASVYKVAEEAKIVNSNEAVKVSYETIIKVEVGVGLIDPSDELCDEYRLPQKEEDLDSYFYVGRIYDMYKAILRCVYDFECSIHESRNLQLDKESLWEYYFAPRPL